MSAKMYEAIKERLDNEKTYRNGDTMNAKKLLRLMAAGRIAMVDPTTSHPHLTQKIVHRALSLLAAAEENDGTTPETDAAEIKVQLGSEYALTGTVHYTTCARLERERNGLAAEVLRLKGDKP